MPPGGPEDRRPPVVVRTEPDTFAVVQDLGRSVRFHFDERISERVAGGTLQDAVTVSPRSGEVQVSHSGRSISVDVRGGLRPGIVYRVTLLPVISDLFGNQLPDPFELVFTTGGVATPTALAGQIWDRTTGQGARGALVYAVGTDSLVHVARADDRGIYAFRYLPEGTFVVTGFEDLDRDGEPGVREVKGSAPATLMAGDTLLLDVPILAPDTTPAVLARAAALDSLTVVLEHDDFLDPEADVAAVVVALSREGGGAPDVSRLYHEHEYTAYVQQVTDSLTSADSAPAARGPALPTAAAPVDTSAVPDRAPAARPGGSPPSRRGPPPLPGTRGAAAPSVGPAGRTISAPPSGRLLPGRRLVARLAEPIEAGIEYVVTLRGVVNLNGLAGGGGEASLLLELPPPPADSTSAADSVAVPAVDQPPDTLPPTPGAPRP